MAGSKDRREGMNPILVMLGQEAFEASARKHGHKPVHTEKLDREGLVQCPGCGKAYVPDLPYNDPLASTTQKEQHISGICSDTCWDRLLG